MIKSKLHGVKSNFPLFCLMWSSDSFPVLVYSSSTWHGKQVILICPFIKATILEKRSVTCFDLIGLSLLVSTLHRMVMNEDCQLESVVQCFVSTPIGSIRAEEMSEWKWRCVCHLVDLFHFLVSSARPHPSEHDWSWKVTRLHCLKETHRHRHDRSSRRLFRPWTRPSFSDCQWTVRETEMAIRRARLSEIVESFDLIQSCRFAWEVKWWERRWTRFFVAQCPSHLFLALTFPMHRSTTSKVSEATAQVSFNGNCCSTCHAVRRSCREWDAILFCDEQRVTSSRKARR